MAAAKVSLVAVLLGESLAVTVPTAPCTCIPMTLTPGADGMVVADLKGPDKKLGGEYGSSCGAHEELFAEDCDSNLTDPVESWCSSAWCWVDPCTCKMDDVMKSSYFSGEFYYSYSNCGGLDTYSTNSTAQGTCAGNDYTPRAECLPRMANDHPLVESEETWCTFGKCREANLSGTMYMYPPSYGEGCGIHAEPGTTDCSNADGTAKASADQADWCKQAFSWVNPCECDASDMEPSGYFPGLYYSYSVCGASDTYTANATKVSAEDAMCPSPAPPVAVVVSPGNFPNSKASVCECQSLPSEVPEVDCTTDYAQGGKCVNATGIPGHMPANYGESCGIHMEPLSSSCFDVANGRPWPSACRGDLTTGCRKAWCDSPFCWVDPCTCDQADIDKSGYFPDGNVYYSYSNCAGVDTYGSTEGVDNSFDKSAVCETEGDKDKKKDDNDKGSSSAATLVGPALSSSIGALVVTLMMLP